MSNNKQKNFLVGYGVVTGVAALGLAYMAWSAGSTASEKTEEVTKKATEIRTLKKATLFPKAENVVAVKAQADDLLADAKKIHDALAKMQVPWEEKLSGLSVQEKINKYRDELTADAKSRGVKLPEGFALGLNRYADTAPTTENGVADTINFIVESVNKALGTVMRANISQIDKISVVPAPWESPADAKAKPGAKPTTTAAKPATTGTPAAGKPTAGAVPPKPPALDEKVAFRRFRVLLQLTGSESSVQEALNSLLTSGEGQPFFTVNTFRIENEQKDGAQKETSFAAETIKDETAAPGAATDLDPEVRDVKFIMGAEKVSAYLDLDLLVFFGSDTQEFKMALEGKSLPAAPAAK